MVDYTEYKDYENPPPVIEPAEHHTLSTEEFEDGLKKRNEKPREGMSLKEAIIATRMKKSDDRKLTTIKSLFEVLMYITFLVVFSFGKKSIIRIAVAREKNSVALSQHSVQTYYYTKVMTNLFVNTPGGESGKAFGDVVTIDDVWDYMNQVLIPGLYWDNTGDNETESAMVYFENKLLGQPRVRMLKVTNESCSVVDAFSREIKECYANYKENAEDRMAFGDGEAFSYQTADKLETKIVDGSIASYGGGGFLQRLPLDDPLTAQANILNLKSNRWIDRGTRLVIVDFALYNANVNLFCVAQLLFELPATGGVLTTARFTTMDLIRYSGTFGKITIAFEGIFVGFILFFLFEEIMELIRVRVKYFKSFWNIVDVIQILLAGYGIWLSYHRTAVAINRVNSVLKNGLTYASFDDVVDAVNRYNDIVSITIFLSWIKLFQYISVNKTMSQLSATLSRSAKDIGGFAVMFAVFFFAYAQFGYLVFGTQIADYSTFYDAVFALLRTILGDFDFDALESTNRILGPNMFLAIINDSYVEVKAELARKKDGLSLMDWIRGKMNGMTRRNKKPHAPQGEVTYDDFKLELIRTGYTEEDINEAFTKYNIENKQEVTDRMMADIGLEIEAEADRQKQISEEHRDYIILSRRVEQIESSIMRVIDRVDDVLDRLFDIEKDKVRAKEHQNQLIAQGFLSGQHSMNVDSELRKRN
ncbi:hypothetical protein WR25_23154 [Diploscapter pachys]|uniref:Uncharacterized protein n=1 Tax=Diploscapter pachys TaxID=2018661 RepID=A0A2A2LZX5_9BILA|nr:hypothetical protein WR25_23154 [Diploscapter pachys]